MSDRLCGCGTVIRNGKCAWGHVQPDAPQQMPAPVDFDFVRLGEKGKVTRGIPIAKLSAVNLITSPAEDVLFDKLNEVIDRINAMNEVSS